MTRVRLWFVVVAAVVVACLGLTRYAGAGVPAGAKYAGSKLCMACHKATDSQMVTGWQESLHSRAFWPVEATDETHKIVADFAQSPPFARDQVAYVVGAGWKQQAFLDKDLKVLPGYWLVAEKRWDQRPATDARTDCLGCHTSGYDPEKAQWKEVGVGCEMCHGPGSTHAGSTDKKGTIVRLDSLDPVHQAMVCGRCHAYGHSKDGRYTFSPTFLPGDDLDASFVLEQTVPANAVNSQYNELRLGGGKHLESGTVCTTCHNTHLGQAPSLRQQGNALCLQCHAGKLTGPQHSEEILKSAQCTGCHMPNGSHVFKLGAES
ncbi:MAG: multiheme c-type cytochrome [Armatimonadota bacterium]